VRPPGWAAWLPLKMSRQATFTLPRAIPPGTEAHRPSRGKASAARYCRANDGPSRAGSTEACRTGDADDHLQPWDGLLHGDWPADAGPLPDQNAVDMARRLLGAFDERSTTTSKGDAPTSPDPDEPTDVNDMDVPPTNLIWYGPPGTGKTYATFHEAVRLCDTADTGPLVGWPAGSVSTVDTSAAAGDTRSWRRDGEPNSFTRSAV
jgi:hypothetical protein